MMTEKFNNKILTIIIYAFTAVIGVAVFIYPFIFNSANLSGLDAQQFQSDSGPIITFLLLIICLAVLFLEVQGQAVSAKVVAALGVLVAATATLRFLEVAIPGPGGFSPIFVPIILSGFVFGPRFGFLMGTLTMLVSALLTGGIGPWLPYQMFASGWVGLSSGWLPHPKDERLTIGILIVFGAVWGLIYGLLLNLYFWPFISGGGNQLFNGSEGLSTQIRNYLAYYISTSFIWDMARSAGNVILIAVIGLPTIKVLSRFRDKYRFEVIGS